MTDFVFLEDTFVDANTQEKVTCGYDRVAAPDAWGMVRFHPHAPTQLLYPPAPTYVHELEGIPQEAILGVLAKTTKPGLAAGLEAVVNKLSDGLNRLEYPPGQRGNPLPVSEVVREEYARRFPQDDDETNIYRMQVYTWRLVDVIRVCKKLLLDPDAIFRTRTSPEPPAALNFAGDRYYADDIRLREPNCEPLLSDAMIIDEGKYRVFRKMPPGYHPRDRPATYHDNYSEITGKPDPLHDFGIKHLRNDAGQATQFRYACCWQAPGSPGCLITYPSKSASQTTRSDQGGLARVAGLPVLYTWFGGFPPSKTTVQFRGGAFVNREYADALHAKIVAALSAGDLIDKIATRKALSASDVRVVAQVAEWMHQYNEPLLGCSLYVREEITASNVDAYLDRVVKDRQATGVSKAKTVPKPVPTDVLAMIESAKRYGLNDFDVLRQAYAEGQDVSAATVAGYRSRLLHTIPLYKAVDINDEWLIDAIRVYFKNDTLFEQALFMLHTEMRENDRQLISRLVYGRSYAALEGLLKKFEMDTAFVQAVQKRDLKEAQRIASDDTYMQKLLNHIKVVLDNPHRDTTDVSDALKFAVKKPFRKVDQEKQMEKWAQGYVKSMPLQKIPGTINDLRKMLPSGVLDVENFQRLLRELIALLSQTQGITIGLWENFGNKTWTTDPAKEGAYLIPVQFSATFREFLALFVQYLDGVWFRKREYADLRRDIDVAFDAMEKKRALAVKKAVTDYNEAEEDADLVNAATLQLSFEQLQDVYSPVAFEVLAKRFGKDAPGLLEYVGIVYGSTRMMGVYFVNPQTEPRTRADLDAFILNVFSDIDSGPFVQDQKLLPYPRTDSWKAVLQYQIGKLHEVYKAGFRDVDVNAVLKELVKGTEERLRKTK